MGDNLIHIDITGDGTINAVLDANGSHGNTDWDAYVFGFRFLRAGRLTTRSWLDWL